jgi:hypothetical protein
LRDAEVGVLFSIAPDSVLLVWGQDFKDLLDPSPIVDVWKLFIVD